jgi:hypothetical protein
MARGGWGEEDVCVFSGRSERGCSSGIYMAELQGVYRAIASLPVGRAVRVHCDSQSVVNAIARYRAEPRVRRRGRMAGRPLLELIARTCRDKEMVRSARGVCAAAVSIEWTRAHASGAGGSEVEVGNRCADWAAKRRVHGVGGPAPAASATAGGSRRARPRADSLDEKNQLAVEHGEEWLCVRERYSDRQVVSGDVRGATMAALRRGAHVTWSRSQSQGTFAEQQSECRKLWQWAVVGAPKRCGFVLGLLADVLQWRERPDVPLMCVHDACVPKPRRVAETKGPSKRAKVAAAKPKKKAEKNVRKKDTERKGKVEVKDVARPGVPDDARHMLVCPRPSRVKRRAAMACEMAALAEQPNVQDSDGSFRRSVAEWRVNCGRVGPAAHTIAGFLEHVGVGSGGASQFGAFSRSGVKAAMRKYSVPKAERTVLVAAWRRVLVLGWGELWGARNGV